MTALPPATLEGWYSLHQAFEIDYAALEAADPPSAEETVRALRHALDEAIRTEDSGWSAAYRLAGGSADLLLVHFRPSIDDLVAVQARVKRAMGRAFRLTFDYLAVTEAGLYHATAEAARDHEPHTPAYRAALEEAAAAELASPHVRTRLYPRPPAEMRYVSFYPMSKRRTDPDNWYVLEVDERDRLMREHGLTGRRYANRIFQVISGSVGLDDWEWGVTLFARDPLEFKRIVTEMRYDEASARYGEFGRFFTGVRLESEQWDDLLPTR